MLSFGSQLYGRSLLKIPELGEIDRRDRDHFSNNMENTMAPSDRSSESEKLFYTDASRVIIKSI